MKIFWKVLEFLKEKKEKLKKLIATTHLLRVVLFTLLAVFLMEGGMAFIELHSEAPTKDVKFCSKDVAELPDEKRCAFLYFLPLKVVSYTAQSSILLMTVVFLYLSVYAEDRWKAKKTKEQSSSGEEHQASSSTEKVYYDYFAIYLAEVFIGSLSISALPTGISLIICGIYGGKPIQLMSGMEIYIAFAGISLAALAFLGALQEQGEIQKGKDIFKETIEDPNNLQRDVSVKTNETSSQGNTPDEMVDKFC